MDDPTPADALAHIAEGICAWCQAPRTFDSLGAHLAKGHGFDMAALRDYLMVSKRFSFASDRHRQACSVRASARWPDIAEKVLSAPRSGTHRLGVFGVASQRAKAEAAWEAQRRMGRRDIDRRCEVCGETFRSSSKRKTCRSASCLFTIRSEVSKARPRRVSTPRMDDRACVICGATLRVLHSSRRTSCAGRCSVAAASATAMMRGRKTAPKPKPCTVCGKDTGTSKRRTCSPECYRVSRVLNAVANVAVREAKRRAA